MTMSTDLRESLDRIYAIHIGPWKHDWSPLRKTDSLICREFWGLLCLSELESHLSGHWSEALRWAEYDRQIDLADDWDTELSYSILSEIAKHTIVRLGLPLDEYLAKIQAATEEARKEIASRDQGKTDQRPSRRVDKRHGSKRRQVLP
jgi:hypothetical protein